MNLAVVQRVVGLLLMVFSLTMLPPVAVSFIYADGAAREFMTAFAFTLVAGTVIWLPVKRQRRDLRLRDGFLVVSLFWTVLGLFGGIPLYLSGALDLGITDAAFEAISGLTTTGATVIVGLDDLPASILYYRQQLQWLGGMGIIVLAVAVLPMLGVGGMQLYRAETPGPVKDAKLTPRITETAKALWYIYVGLTAACAIAYWMAGMTGFDAIGHAFSTVAIGGFSTHDLSVGFFKHPVIEAIAIVFMVLAGTNFSLHFLAFRNKTLRPYANDPEFGFYIRILFFVMLVVMATLFSTGFYADWDVTIMRAAFHTVSIATTTGFITDDFASWPVLAPVLLVLASFIGACAHSTGGGMKVIRIALLYKQGLREILRLLHPKAAIAVKLGHRAVPPRVVRAVWGFFSAYVGVFAIMMLVLMATGIDHVTAFSAVAACLNNLGPGLGDVAAHYGDVGGFAKWVLVLAMLMGRLEIFTLLVLFMPEFWRK